MASPILGLLITATTVEVRSRLNKSQHRWCGGQRIATKLDYAVRQSAGRICVISLNPGTVLLANQIARRGKQATISINPYLSISIKRLFHPVIPVFTVGLVGTLAAFEEEYGRLH